jgi:DNA adenine methylase
VARDSGEELKRKLEYTPYSKVEYIQAYKPTDDPIEQARRTVIRSFMGRANTGAAGNSLDGEKTITGFRGRTPYCGKTSAKVWASYPEAFDALIARLKGVVIENRNAIEIIDLYDTEQTFFYIDPPYLFSVRDAGTDYRYEMTDEQHIELAKKLNEVKGMVIVSGYHSELYNDLYQGWKVQQKITYSDGDKTIPRTEVLWMKGIEQPDLFSGAEGI